MNICDENLDEIWSILQPKKTLGTLPRVLAESLSEELKFFHGETVFSPKSDKVHHPYIQANPEKAAYLQGKVFDSERQQNVLGENLIQACLDDTSIEFA